jgi:hypothetical protein
VHLDETEATVGVLTSEQDGVCIAHNPDVRQILILVGLGERKHSLQIVRWDFHTGSGFDA